ncbi:MAG: hypothetical protein JNL38_38030 [Myxococcales bacterium]|jgi:hypothetical protein|nr:hypothetical protein [Myxococcales bacterium]
MGQERDGADRRPGHAALVWWVALGTVVTGHVLARDLAELGHSTDAALALLGADLSIVGLACVAALLVGRRRGGRARRRRPLGVEQLPRLWLEPRDAEATEATEATASTLSVPS